MRRQTPKPLTGFFIGRPLEQAVQQDDLRWTQYKQGCRGELELQAGWPHFYDSDLSRARFWARGADEFKRCSKAWDSPPLATPRPRSAKSILAPTLPGLDVSIRVPTLLARVEREVVESWGRGSRSRPRSCRWPIGRARGGSRTGPPQAVSSCSEDLMPLSTHVFCFCSDSRCMPSLYGKKVDHVSGSS